MTDATMNKCWVCGEPMPPGEQMFKFHGYSGPCPKPPLVFPHPVSDDPLRDIESMLGGANGPTIRLRAELDRLRASNAELAEALGELVTLKDMKDAGFGSYDTEGEDEYLRRKPIAWANAKDVLARHKEVSK